MTPRRRPTISTACNHCTSAHTRTIKRRIAFASTTAPQTRSFKAYQLRSSRQRHPLKLNHMDDSENTHTDKELWADDMEEILIDMLHADALTGAIKGGRITSRDHARYAQRLTTLGRRVYDGSQVKGKIHRLKGKQRLFTDLINQTGFGWDPTTGTIISNDEHWAHAIRAKPQWRNFRTAGCPKYQELCTIFGASVAIGVLGHASNQPPPTSDEELQLDEDMRCRTNVTSREGVGMDGPTTDFLIRCGQSSVSSGQNGRGRRRGATSRLGEDMSNCLSELAKTSIARRKRYEEQSCAAGSKRSKATASSNSDAHFDQQTQCVKILQEFDPPLPTENLLRAYNALMGARQQTGFLALDPVNRRHWAMSL